MHVIVVGNGVAGVTTAVALRELDKHIKITIVSGESLYHYSRPALMYIYMKDMKLKHTQPYENWFWKKNKIDLVHDWVTEFDFQNKQIELKNENRLAYDKLILAVGAKGNKFGWPGQDLPGVLTFTNLRDLEELETRTKKITSETKAVVIGGGLIGVEVAEMLGHRKVPTTFLVREDTYWPICLSAEEGRMIQEEIIDHNIGLKMSTELQEIHPDSQGEVGKVTTNKGESIECSLVVLAAGVSPYTEPFKGTNLKLGRGIQVNSQFETNLPDVYACGDCAEILPDTPDTRPVVELLWYTGKMHGKVLARNILGENIKYERGIWYNSAKFFGIDYHTYGQVNQNIPGESELYYRVPEQRKSIRIVYLSDRVIGFNTLGIRYRDNVCRKWIEQKRPLGYVLEHLEEANFDPEFFTKFEEEMRKWAQKKAS